MPQNAKLLEKLLNRSMPEPNSGCLLWLKNVNDKGYGRFATGGKRAMAHRLIWALVHGPIQGGLLVCHRCDVPSCINVDHLFLGTTADNIRDKVSKRRHRFGERHRFAKLSDEQARAICADTRGYRLIAAEYGIGVATISAIRTGRSWSHLSNAKRLKRPPSDGGGNARLTGRQVLDILADHRGVGRIARDYGVAHATISDIRSGRTWKHLQRQPEV